MTGIPSGQQNDRHSCKMTFFWECALKNKCGIFPILLDRKYLQSARRSFEQWFELANKNGG
jgi:hypothetical protein